MSLRVYVASSWKNVHQPHVVTLLRSKGYEVYDFRHPVGPSSNGFSWDLVDNNWEKWTPVEYVENLQNSLQCGLGYNRDKDALDWCDVGILILPSGNSAHLEAGYLTGQGKPVIVFNPGPEMKPDLMYLLCWSIALSKEVLLEQLLDLLTVPDIQERRIATPPATGDV
jgi:hypothetical protein